MKYENDEVEASDREPGLEVTSKLFREWQVARRGRVPAEDMTNPVWQWLFRGRVDPYHANERFKPRLKKLFPSLSLPTQPRWAGCRLGQSRTELNDGRVFWIAGEHEDYYDPDFFIYNDIIVQHPDGHVKIFGYPVTSFRPTDFHSATAVDDERSILIIGNVGYAEQRDVGQTQIYRLDIDTLSIQSIDSVGDRPGWISDHRAELSQDRGSIVIRGGKVMQEDGFLENIDDWSLSLNGFRWTRLTERKWIRFQVGRVDGEGLHLWQYEMSSFAQAHSMPGLESREELARELGAPPNMPAYDAVYRPPLNHVAVDVPLEDDDWQTKKVIIDDVIVRYVDDMEHLSVTIEGPLPSQEVDQLAEDLRATLTLVENCECRVKWIDKPPLAEGI